MMSIGRTNRLVPKLLSTWLFLSLIMATHLNATKLDVSNDSPDIYTSKTTLAGEKIDTKPITDIVETSGKGVFLENKGQRRKEVFFYLELPELSLEFLRDGVKYKWHTKSSESLEYSIQFIGCNNVEPKGFNLLPGRYNYFYGGEGRYWITNVSSYSQLKYENLYDKVDLIYYVVDSQVKYDFIIHPGASVGQIKVKYVGVTPHISNGKLILSKHGMSIYEGAPFSYQKDIGDEINVSWIINDEKIVGFSAGEYDLAKDLVIDPLIYSTFLGGSSDDKVTCTAVEDDVLYVTGLTYSSNFPVTNGTYQGSNRGGYDIFVMAFNTTTMQLIYSTYIGGGLNDYAAHITVDKMHNVYLTGHTYSNNFPTTTGVYDRSFNGWLDVIVLKLDRNGSALLFSTFLGGSNYDYGNSISVNKTGYVFVGGTTLSSNFPTTESAFSRSLSSGRDCFVSILSPTASQLISSTYVGGSGDDFFFDIVLNDTNKTLYIGGTTRSTDFPVMGGYDVTYNGGDYDIYVALLPYNLTKIIKATYYGGTGSDQCTDILTRATGEVVLTGWTGSSSLNLTSNAFDSTYNGNGDGLVVIFNQNLTQLRYATYIGGRGDDAAASIEALDRALFIRGRTKSPDFPVVSGSYDTTYNGGWDTFLAVLDTNTSQLLYGTFLGGSGDDWSTASKPFIALDDDGYAYLTGTTASTSFPTTSNALSQNYRGGIYDGFLTKLYPRLPGPVENLTCEDRNYSVRLKWTPPKYTGGVPLDGYVIYRGTSPTSLTEFCRVGNVTEFIDGFYNVRHRYYYRVRAFTIGGMGGFSPIANGIPYTAPSRPENFAGSTESNNVTLSWTEPLDNGGWPVTHYRIYRSEDGVHFFHIASTGNLSFKDVHLLPGKYYYYYVTAVNYVGEGEKTPLYATIPYTHPSEPRNLRVTPLPGKIMISWLEPLFNGGLPITGYRIYRSTDFSNFSLYVEVPPQTIQWMDTNISYGVRYYYYVTAVNSYGEGGRSDIGSAIPGKVPSPVTDLRAKVGRKQIVLMWSEPVDISGYEILDYIIYRSVDGREMKPVAVTRDTEWIDLNITLGRKYRYGVEARNVWGVGERGLTGEIVVGAPPGKVSHLTVTGEMNAVYLYWDIPENTGGVPPEGYIIYKGVQGNMLELCTVLSRDDLEYTDHDVIPGVTYVYAVTAYNTFGEGARAFGEATPYTHPGVPRNFTGMPGDGWVELSWREPSFDGGRPIEGYLIYWQATGELDWRIEEVGPNIRTYRIEGLSNGVTYRFSIRSFSEVAQSELTEILELVPASTPDAPGSLSAVYEPGQVILTWSQPRNDGGSEILGYRIYRSVGGGKLELLSELGPTALRYKDKSIMKGEYYTYAVAAFSEIGEGQLSKMVHIFPATPPGAVKGFTVVSKGIEQVDLYWDGVGDDGGYPITGYVIYRGLSPARMEKLAKLSADSRGYSDTALEAGKEYFYIIKAENSLGEGEPSEYISVLFVSNPGSVVNFKVTYSKNDKAVLLSWDGVENNGGSDIIEYIIYRGEEGGYIREYARVDGESRVYIDRNVKDGVRYVYRIRAANSEGLGEPVEDSVYVPSKLWQVILMGLLGLIPILFLYLLQMLKKIGERKRGEPPGSIGPTGEAVKWAPPLENRRPPLPPPLERPPEGGGEEKGTEIKYIPPPEGGD